jgi:hypothetical protein
LEAFVPQSYICGRDGQVEWHEIRRPGNGSASDTLA